MFGTTEKNRSGPPEAKVSPRLPKFTPLPKRFFSQYNPREPICPVHLCVIRMKQELQVPLYKMVVNLY
jgi:hypothetical protein